MRQVFSKSSRKRTPQSWELYREAQWIYTERRIFCNSVNDLPMSARLQRALSRDPKIKLGYLVALLGMRTESIGETLELMMLCTFVIC